MKIFCMCFLVIVFVFEGLVLGDWQMPGHDPQRSSWAQEDTVSPSISHMWTNDLNPTNPWLAANVQIVTSAVENKIYVTGADGIYALDPVNGNQLWKYPLTLPPGDAPTYVNGVLYICCLDKTIHAVNAATGANIWQTDEAEMGFYVNPVVVNSKVYAGNLDGYFYCFDATDGSYLWSYEVGEPIKQSAAYQTYADYPEGVIFFAAMDLCAHAIRADNGQLIWKSAQLLGAERFTVWWPVIFDDLVIFVSGTLAPSHDDAALYNWQRDGMAPNFSDIQVDANGWYDLQHHRDWQDQHPYLRTVHVLNRTDGTESQKSTFMHAGPQGCYRTPVIVGPNPAATGPEKLLWARSTWEGTSWFGYGRLMGWWVGTGLVRLVPGLDMNMESADEGEEYCMVGDTYLVSSMGTYGEGGFELGIMPVSGGVINDITAPSHGVRRGERKYQYWGCLGCAPSPLNGRIYRHDNCSVLCFGL